MLMRLTAPTRILFNPLGDREYSAGDVRKLLFPNKLAVRASPTNVISNNESPCKCTYGDGVDLQSESYDCSSRPLLLLTGFATSRAHMMLPAEQNAAERLLAHVDGGDQENDEQWVEQIAIGQGTDEVNGTHGNGARMKGNGSGFGIVGYVEDQGSKDEVISEQMRSTSAQSPGGFSDLLSGLALSGQSHAMHTNGNSSLLPSPTPA
ncbi:hypothetical protein BDV93DRAFT_562328 [Ceratobasidium sp. AG-I]|nr:hypothetical protein BDV93DRAFT_562328 [Ceratobasidium sp. AG-I]